MSTAPRPTGDDPRASWKPWPHPACLDPNELLKSCRVQTGRSGGPGGQNRNKVETLVSITHEPTGTVGEAGERRTQGENYKVALRRLRLRLASVVRCPVRVPRGMAAIDGPWTSDLWRSRVSRGPLGASGARGGGGRISCNPTHTDYPALVAEAMDVVADCAYDPKPAALRLGVTPTQLVRLVKDCAEALNAWNAQRRQRGLHTLK